ncbi:carboxypeptidase regulatory-like domain-containing protein [Promicromonospora sp. NPDC060271]|uniref:carboxypeptidase regulatory-like domain-containing protein n=1 Tax=Promicromonospora sp. NPDC060271 TaxID=3347089 RepID=UPI00364F369A
MAFAGTSPAVAATTTKAVAADPEDKFTDFAREMLAERKTADFWVEMADEADLTDARGITNWDERGQRVYDALTSTAEASQASLIKQLDAAGADYESYWISNRILVQDGTLALADKLAKSGEVQRISETVQLNLVEPVKRTDVSDKGTLAVEWGLDAINAPEVWEMGYTGEGITVSNIDTGVQYDHPALADQYRGKQADGTVVNDYNWQDTSGSAEEPFDDNGHGTHTIGTMVGDDGNGNQIGVAPGADWIATNGCDSCSDAALLSSGQWIVAPTKTDGSDPDPSKRPNIVNNSWGLTAAGSIDDWYTDTTEAWEAAGIFGTWSAGNSGPGCTTTSSPGANTGSYSVGAFDVNGAIAGFSSRGAGEDGLVKPNIAAPGVNVRSSVPGDGYAAFNGTSMAAPHLAGAVALLWSAAPALIGDIEGTQALLDEAAVDTNDTTCGGTADDNNVWGEGKLDVAALIDAAPIGATGYVNGTVTDADGAPISGADVTVDGERDRTVSTDEDGTFSARVPTGDYAVSASAFGFLPSEPTPAAVTEDGTVDVPITLEAAPSHAVTGTVTFAGSGDPVAGAPVSLGSHFEDTTTGTDGTFAFADVPEGTYPLTVEMGGCASTYEADVVVDGAKDVPVEITAVTDDFGYSCATSTGDYRQGDTKTSLTGDDAQTSLDLPFAFPFYGESYDTAFVTSNGHLNFLAATTSYANGPIPSSAAPNAALYPFWDDLLIDAESGLYTGTTTVDGEDAFVLEWRNVRKYSPASDRLNFSVTLVADGTAIFGYGDVTDTDTAKGSSASIGIENANGTVGMQYSNNTAAISSGLTITYTAPVLAFLEGTVTDLNTGDPVKGATVTATAEGVTRTATSQTDGTYSAIALPGDYTVEITAPDYESESGTVTLEPEGTGTFDAALAAGKLAVSTGSISTTLPLGSSTTKRFTVKNEGTAPADVELVGTGGGFDILGAEGAAVIQHPQGEATVAESTKPSAKVGGSFGSSGTRLQAAGKGTTGKAVTPESIPVSPNATTITHSTSQEIVELSSASCGGLAGTTENHFFRTFTLSDFGIDGDFEVSEVSFGVEQATAQTLTVKLHTLEGALTFANLTQIGTADVTIPASTLTMISVPVTGEVPAGSTLVVEIVSANQQANGGVFYIGSNGAGQSAPSYLSAADCSLPEPATTDSIGWPDMHIVMNVSGDTAGGGSMDWVTTTPAEFTLAPGQSKTITATLNGVVAQPGTFTGKLVADAATPYDAPSVDVSMQINPPKSWGKLSGTVGGFTPDGVVSLGDSVVQLNGYFSKVTLVTGADGKYEYWFDKSERTAQIIATANGYVPQVGSAKVTAGKNVVTDFELDPLK